MYDVIYALKLYVFFVDIKYYHLSYLATHRSEFVYLEIT